MNKERFDVIVIGAGPAGLSCALDLHESRINYVVLERNQEIGGQLKDIENTIRDFGGGFFNNGKELKEQLAALSQRVGLHIKFDCQVESIDLSRRTVICNGTSYQAQTIVLATGCRVRKLTVPGIASASVDVFYQNENNLDKLQGHDVAIIGGGDNALMDALVLSDKVPKVYVIHHSNQLKARPDVIQSAQSHERIKIFLQHELTEVFSQQGRIRGISIFDKAAGLNQTIAVERLLVCAGAAPNTEQVKGQVRMDAGGRIYVDQWCATSAPGLYACGDISSPGYSRLATAMGQGSMAALAIRTNEKAPSPA